jgi:hypothetical protein
VRLQVAADRAVSKHVDDSRNRGKGDSRRSWPGEEHVWSPKRDSAALLHGGQRSVRYRSVRDQQPARDAVARLLVPRCSSATASGGSRANGQPPQKSLNASEVAVGHFGGDQGQAMAVRDARINTQALCDRVPGTR